MAVTTAPSVEATTEIVDRINAGSAYCLHVLATRPDNAVDPVELVTDLRVDVVHEDEEELNETLDVENRTSHQIRIWIRKHAGNQTNRELDPLKLVVRQIFQQVNNFDSADQRVKVWDAELETKQIPDKSILRQVGMFVVSILLRVEVEASA